MRAQVFQPGGRARLCEFACSTATSEILESALDNPVQVRKTLLRNLRNIAFRQSLEKKHTTIPTVNESIHNLSDGLRLATELLICWRGPLPKHGVEFSTFSISIDHEAQEVLNPEFRSN